MELNSEKEVFDVGQWLHDFDEHVKHSSKERQEQFNDNKLARTSVAANRAHPMVPIT
jgi:hypothetical protein